MDIEKIKITPIVNGIKAKGSDYYSVCWIKSGVKSLNVNNTLFKNVSNAIFFFNSNHHWKLVHKAKTTNSGYILSIPKIILEHHSFRNLHVKQLGLFNVEEIPKINLSPGIEKRIQSILEMLDELISTRLDHREEAIISLLNTFFIYCDGKCNIKSYISDQNAKSALVYKLKRCIDQYVDSCHEVKDYADKMNVSKHYLNECVKKVLGRNAKDLIQEQLLMRARQSLKFSDKSIKEISCELGFTSADYFSYFIKKNTGQTPSEIRKN